MKCPSRSPDAAKFCNAGGAGLQLICPVCARTNVFGSRCCSECGQALEGCGCSQVRWAPLSRAPAISPRMTRLRRGKGAREQWVALIARGC